MQAELREALKNRKEFEELPKTGKMILLKSLFSEEELTALKKYSAVILEFGGINYPTAVARVFFEKDMVPQGTKVIRDIKQRFVGIEAITAGSTS